MVEFEDKKMPKIECNEKLFFNAIGKKYTYDVLEDLLPCAKAELDEKPDMSMNIQNILSAEWEFLIEKKI